MDVLAALADPVRRDLLVLLRQHPLTAGELADAFPISRPAISRHLRVLREHGLVQVEGRDDDARARVYRLDVAPLAEVDAWLAPFRFPSAGAAPTSAHLPIDLDGALDALETEVARTRRDRRAAASTDADPISHTDTDTDTRSTA